MPGSEYAIIYLNAAQKPIAVSNIKAVGTYYVKVTMKGNYSGSKTVEFKIIPKGTTILNLISASKGFTVKWKKPQTQMTGYQIQYALNSAFTSGKKTVSVKNTSTVSKKITDLKGKRKYYVRIRTYKTIGKTNYYSSWSSVKYITTKA